MTRSEAEAGAFGVGNSWNWSPQSSRIHSRVWWCPPTLSSVPVCPPPPPSFPPSFSPFPQRSLPPSLPGSLPFSSLLAFFILSRPLSHSFFQYILNSSSVWDSVLIMIRKTRLLRLDAIQLKRHWLFKLCARCWTYWVYKEENSTGCDLKKCIAMYRETDISLLICLFIESLCKVLELLTIFESVHVGPCLASDWCAVNIQWWEHLHL